MHRHGFDEQTVKPMIAPIINALLLYFSEKSPASVAGIYDSDSHLGDGTSRVAFPVTLMGNNFVFLVQSYHGDLDAVFY